MFKLNNKGFAFSTILYGLMLMAVMVVVVIMSLMQTNRLTNKRFVENIENELNRFSLTESTFNGNILNEGQEYIVPMGQSGWYKIELWGAQGQNSGGLGSYTSGMIWLKENTHLYFYVGKQGSTFNGGGNKVGSGYLGGGATDVRLSNGQWDSSLNKRIMVAAGGGGGSTGGAGGTILGLNGTGANAGTGALQNSGSFGKGVSGSGTDGSGGGGGYYGGNGSSGAGGGGGGSSYISGYAGVYTNGAAATTATYYTPTAEEALNTPAYFINGVMLPGVRKGDGLARIEKVISTTNVYSASVVPAILNNKIYNTTFRYVKDCISGTKKIDTATSSATVSPATWKGIQVIKNGKNIAYNTSMMIEGTSDEKKTVIGQGLIATGAATKVTAASTGEKCMIVDLGTSVSNVSEIAVWHDFDTYGGFVNFDTGINAINHHLYIGNSLASMVEVTTGSAESLQSAESYNGFHYSAWQPDSTINGIEDGTYYIMSAASDNLFATYSAVGANADFYMFNGSAKQQWNIKKTDASGHYLITTVDGGFPLQVMDGTNYDNSYIGVNYLDGYYEWNQWFIKPAGNGMYYIYANIHDQLGVAKDTYLGMAYDDNWFYNAQKTLKSRTLVAPSSADHNGAKNRMMRVKILAVNY